MSERAGHSPEKVEFPKVEAETERKPRSLEKEHSDKEKESIKPEEARNEVAEALRSKEKKEDEPQKVEKAEAEPAHVITPTQKKAAYKKTMHEMQSSLSPTSRSFSKFIHNPAIENTSEVLGRTVARPTSILYGSLCAFLLLSGVYLLAQRNGFQLSGFEFIGLFAIGWLIGLVVDFLHHMITGQR